MLIALLILSCSPVALLDYAMAKWQVEAGFQIEDAYKWLYQATRGGEHATPDRQSASKWLEQEWALLQSATKDPVWEPLCPDGSIGRLNLRPFRDRGGSKDAVLEAFLDSSGQYRPEPDLFLEAWRKLGDRLKYEPVGRVNYREWQRLDAALKAKDYPAVHHSTEYKRANAPAYRILTRQAYEAIYRTIEAPR
jgi:hypothetical protein